MDARIPLRIADNLDLTASHETAYLLEGSSTPTGLLARPFELPPPTHATLDCTCCLPLGPVAAALNGLFIERAKGGMFFRQVLAIPATKHGRAAIYAALQSDPVVTTRFRLEGPSSG